MKAITHVEAASAPNVDNGYSADDAAAFEATELRAYRPDSPARSSTAATSGHPSARSSQLPSRKPRGSASAFVFGLCLAVRNFWSHQVVITVPHDTCRDHLGAFMLCVV